METIWYVFKKFGGAPSFRHPSYGSAVAEAKRLVDTIGGEYEILEFKGLVKAAPKHLVLSAGYPRPSYDDGVPF